MQGVAPQNRHILSLTEGFLNVHWDRKKPLLLGYSGGVDSKALLYALLEMGVKPHLAHVDHGWRIESREEAELLRQEAIDLGCPFFSTQLQLPKKEDAARKGRFAFFQSLFPQYEALLLAHHADDLAETVLKRIFEGAHLTNFASMQPVSHQFGITIWRPLLQLKRSEIWAFLEEKNLKPFLDSSNEDPTYLRARMRKEIFPYLNQMFGKEISANLLLLSERARELNQYLDRKIQRVKIERGPWGVLVNLEGMERVEQRHLLLKISKEESFVLTRDVVETLLDWVQKQAESKYLVVKMKKILVDKGRIFFISSNSKCSL